MKCSTVHVHGKLRQIKFAAGTQKSKDLTVKKQTHTIKERLATHDQYQETNKNKKSPIFRDALKEIERLEKSSKQRQFLISCDYEYYCQGFEETYGYFLVSASTFEEACKKLESNLSDATNFHNCNVE